MATASPARDEKASYIAWGHSSAVSPWGEVIATANEKEGIVYADIGIFLLILSASSSNQALFYRLGVSPSSPRADPHNEAEALRCLRRRTEIVP